MDFDPRDLGRMVASLAPKLREALEALSPAVGSSSIDTLYVACDGTGTPMRREELHRVAGRQEDGSARTREAKLGCVFTQTDTDAHGNPLRDEDGNPEWSPSKCEAITLQINYLQSHSTRTHYGGFRQAGLFIGSGVVEAGCKTVVGRRLKQSGMFWSQSGAENILNLRCLVLGPHFDCAWEELRTINAREQLKARRWLNHDAELAA